MIKRSVQKSLENALKRQSAVALLGPRQVGKTTLAQTLSSTRSSIYLDLEDPEDRTKLMDPSAFFNAIEDQLVILDEIHRMPELFSVLRGVIDRRRRRGKDQGGFLLLGSASLDLLKGSGESLAGRITYLEMTQFLVDEVDDESKLWSRGGFPQSYLAEDDQESLQHRKDFIRTYLERDVSLFAPQLPRETLRRLWTMLAHNQGSLLNGSVLGRALQISTQSVSRYIGLLEDMMLVRRLLPYHPNISKRLVKSPKTYIRDSGWVHALLGLGSLVQVMGSPVVGLSWEGFVIENLMAYLPWGTSAFFYRTSVGSEIDLVWEHHDGTLWVFEIKRSLSRKPQKGFYLALEDLKPSRAFVVHGGEGHCSLSAHTEAIGLRDLVKMLKEKYFS